MSEKKHMSVDTIHHIGLSTAETTPLYEQPPDEPDATILPKPESYANPNHILHLSSTVMAEHERALLLKIQAEVTALAEEIRQADLVLARISKDLHYVDEQVSDLGHIGAPQVTARRNHEEEYKVAAENKANLVLLHKAKLGEIDVLKANQNRREWLRSEYHYLQRKRIDTSEASVYNSSLCQEKISTRAKFMRLNLGREVLLLEAS